VPIVAVTSWKRRAPRGLPFDGRSDSHLYRSIAENKENARVTSPSQTPPSPRSPLLLDAATSSLLVVDLQTKLLPKIPQQRALLANVELLLDAANLLEIPVACTEQYPAGLGPSAAEVRQRVPTSVWEKRMFSCRECQDLFQQLDRQQRRQILVVGIETHVCVLQTVLDLLAMGFECYLAVDATGSRHLLDFETAIDRMEISGATMITTESVLFEWCQDSRHPHFKQVSAWIKDRERRLLAGEEDPAVEARNPPAEEP